MTKSLDFEGITKFYVEEWSYVNKNTLINSNLDFVNKTFSTEFSIEIGAYLKSSKQKWKHVQYLMKSTLICIAKTFPKFANLYKTDRWSFYLKYS